MAQDLLIVYSSMFLLKQLPNHDQDQAHRHADDQGDETSIGQDQKIMSLYMISVARVLEIAAIDSSSGRRTQGSAWLGMAKGSKSSVPQPVHTSSVAGVTPSQCWQKITRCRGVVISQSAAKWVYCQRSR